MNARGFFRDGLPDGMKYLLGNIKGLIKTFISGGKIEL
jgi:hypothetical protein